MTDPVAGPARPPSRRSALLQIAAVLGGAGAARAQSRWAREQDPEIVQILADFEPGALEPGAGLIADIRPALFRMLSPEGVRRRVLTFLVRETPPAAHVWRWPADARAVDYAHLGPIGADEGAPFDAGAEALERAARLSALPIGRDRPVLFALRGAEIVAARPDRLTLRSTRPDLRRLACVLGVWTPQTGRLAAFAGSTTPSLLHAHAQARLKNAGRVAGLLPTGLLRFSVGAHRPETPRPQAGAFRLAEPVSALRDYGRAEPELFALDGGAWMLDGAPIAQGLHAASFDGAPFGGVCAFSSSGGPTVAGGYDAAGRPFGDWAAFRRAAGLADDPTARDRRRFELLLLTGAELRRAALGRETPALRRLRFGSEGPRVAALQAALGLAATGRFDVATQIAVLRTQLLEGARADGIVTPRWARDRFGLAL